MSLPNYIAWRFVARDMSDVSILKQQCLGMCVLMAVKDRQLGKSALHIHSFHWHVQNRMIPCHSEELLPFLFVIYPFLPPTSLPSSLTSSCCLFLCLLLSLLVSKFIYNTFLGILFSSILCTCPNQHNLFNLIVSVVVGFLTIA